MIPDRNTLRQIIESVALSDAQRWHMSEDKYSFCLDFLGLSLLDEEGVDHSITADAWVDALETRFSLKLKGL